MKRILTVAIAAAAGAAFGAIERLQHVWNAKDGDAVDVPCVVTSAFPDAEDGFVAADVAQYDRGGVIVKPPAGGEIEGTFGLGAGEAVVVRGTVVRENGTPVICANRVMRTGRIEMTEPPPPKISDFRKGWLHLRRTRIEGWVVSCNDEPREGGGVDSVLWLRVPGTRGSVAVVVRGGISGAAAEPNAVVAASGVVMNEMDSEGRFIAAHIEANAADVRVVQAVPPNWWRIVAIGAGILLALALVAFAVYRIRIHRQRADERLLAADRRRIADDLHDNMQQLLAGIGFRLDAAATVLGDTQAAAKQIAGAKKILGNAQAGLRSVLWGLQETRESPATLEGLFEYAAARMPHWDGVVEIKGVGWRSGILPLEPRTDVRRHGGRLLMILQEAVQNAMAHGGARHVAVSLAEAGSVFTMTIADDGAGFDTARRDGFGIASMRRRAEEIGGTLRIESEPGNGTTVTVEIKEARHG